MRLLLLPLLAALAFAQNTARFPGATATFQDLLVAKGPATATLTADLTDSATTIPVTDGAQYANFSAVQIETEVILVCSIAGNTLNVCPGGRGFSGTTAAAHLTGRAVRNTITTHHHNQLAAEVKATQEALGANLSNVVTPASLAAWSGSASITTIGTLSAGTVPWARLSNVPSTFTPGAHSHVIGDLSTVGDWSSKITSGTYSISVSGSAGSVAWTGVSGRPTALSQLTNDSGFQTSSGSVYYANSAGAVAWTNVSGRPAVVSPASGDGTRITANQLGCGSYYNDSCDPGGNGAIDYADSAGYAVNTGNADTVDSLHVHAGANTEANKIVRTDSNGYLPTGWISTISGDAGTGAIARVYASADSYIRYYTLDNFSKQVFNARQLDASWTWIDDYVSLPTGVVQWGVFTPRAASATIASVVCWADTSDAVIQLRRSGDNGDMINGNLACNGTASTNLNGYASIPIGYYVGMWAVSGTAKRINVAISYTTGY